MSAIPEDEARGKWCPFGPTHHVPGTEGCEIDVPKSRSRCIGSACMAWRWDAVPAHGIYRPEDRLTWISAGRTYACEPSRPIWMTDAWSWDETQGWWTTGEPITDRGYCGLAGSPS